MDYNNSNNYSGAYAHLLLIFKELSSRIKTRIEEAQTTNNLNRQLITMTDINSILSDFEDMLNNSLSVLNTEVTISAKQVNKQTQNQGGNIQTNENLSMNKNKIRLTESDLRRIIKESVTRILKEGSYGDYEFTAEAEILEDFLDNLVHYADKELEDDVDRFCDYCNDKEYYVKGEISASYDEEVGYGSRYSPVFSIEKVREPVELKKVINEFDASDRFKAYALDILDKTINELDVDDFDFDVDNFDVDDI